MLQAITVIIVLMGLQYPTNNFLCDNSYYASLKKLIQQNIPVVTQQKISAIPLTQMPQQKLINQMQRHHPRVRLAIKEKLPLLYAQMKANNIRLGGNIYLRAFKKEAILQVWLKPQDQEQYILFKNYQIFGMSGKLGPKLKEGDLQVPEGFYRVSYQQMLPTSSYHLAFNIGYPNTFDRSHSRTGSFIMVHGGKSSTGCLAMSNKYIKEIYLLCLAAFQQGQQLIHCDIFPFMMTSSNMLLYRNHRWYNFWQKIQPGYLIFEQHKIPPSVEVIKKQYLFQQDTMNTIEVD